MDADEPSGLADAAALVEVLEDREGLLLGEMAAVQRRALALGEAGPAGVAVELAELLVLAVAAADREVAGVAPAVERTVGILAAEACEVVHQGLRTTFSCVFEGFSRELSSHYIININCNALYSPIHYRKVANM